MVRQVLDLRPYLAKVLNEAHAGRNLPDIDPEFVELHALVRALYAGSSE